MSLYIPLPLTHTGQRVKPFDLIPRFASGQSSKRFRLSELGCWLHYHVNA